MTSVALHYTDGRVSNIVFTSSVCMEEQKEKT